MNPEFPNISTYQALESLVKEFPQAQVFLVGGAVRDILLGEKVTDIDMLVRNVEADDLEEFLANHGRVVFAGKRFGIWKFNEIAKPENEICDIALPRTEFSMHKQGIYQDFDIKTDPKLDIEKDLERRDFTINAMAYNLVDEKLIDTHNGQKDLKDKIIRTVGSPRERFQEDYSRMLRALRFSLQLDSKIEKETLATIKKMIPNINNEIDSKRVLANEIVSEELLKSLAINPSATLDLWDKTGALEAAIPELLEMKGCVQPENWHTEGDVWDHTRLALEKLSSNEFKKEFNDEPIELELVMAALFHDIGKPYTLKTPEKDGVDRIRYDDHDEVGATMAKQILERLRASAPSEVGININHVVWMVQHHMLLVHGDPDIMRPNTIEKYFFSSKYPSRNFLKLLYLDSLATIGPDGKSFTEKYEQICNRIDAIKKKTQSHGTKLVKPLITGEHVMDLLNLKPGKKVGKVLEEVRSKQLSGKLASKDQALEYLKQL
ncbi:MAG: CCA tRNA nucleotidyltransferase [Patescibacteria group bacterium]|jgi:poly(A) polymerase|nr:CCA tRNA nucleotidyltransferase [Patescibacteria group bacterium]|tara:strand:- start:30951 stop:32426 length:1476 start_codon:yes stop_codon:yes gene_type:complete